MSKVINTRNIAQVLLQPQCSALVLLALMSLPTTGIDEAVANTTRHEGLTATLVYTFRPTQQVVLRGSLALSKQGLWIAEADSAEGSGEIAIANNQLQKYWHVDEDRGMVHEVPLTVLDDTMDITSIVLGLPEGIDNAPCIGAQGTLIGDIEYKGRTLQSWQCSIDLVKAREEDQMHLPARQYYSPELGLVVYSLNHDQIETELVDIEIGEVDPSLFLPAPHLRPVSIDEYSGLLSVLEDYEKRAQKYGSDE